MFRGLAPGIMPLSVEEGVADGVSEVRKAVRYQLKYGAKVIKVSASGGIMSVSGPPGAQQYSDEEFAAIVDEAHRAGVRVAAHAHGDAGIRACIRAGHRLHRARLAGQRRDPADDGRPRHLPGGHQLPLGGSRRLEGRPASSRPRPPSSSPRPERRSRKAIEMGVKICTGTDAPAIPHGAGAKELWALVDRGMTPDAGHPGGRRS